jgi:hypothetical protein
MVYRNAGHGGFGIEANPMRVDFIAPVRVGIGVVALIATYA